MSAEQPERGFLSSESVAPKNEGGGKIQRKTLDRSGGQGWAPEDLGSRPFVPDTALFLQPLVT